MILWIENVLLFELFQFDLLKQITKNKFTH